MARRRGFMGNNILYNAGIINRSLLALSLDSSDTTMQVSTGDGSKFPSGPFLGVLTPSMSLTDLDVAEYVEIESKASDVFTFGDRDLYSQAASQSHPAGTMFLEVWQPRHITNIQQALRDVKYAIAHAYGHIETGIKVWGTAGDQMLTTEQSTPDMTVLIKAGFGFRNGIMARLPSEHTTDIISAPSSSALKDLVSMDTIFQLIVITTGTEGAGIPATPSGHFALAEIDLIISQSTIVNGDITDVRIQI